MALGMTHIGVQLLQPMCQQSYHHFCQRCLWVAHARFENLGNTQSSLFEGSGEEMAGGGAMQGAGQGATKYVGVKAGVMEATWGC